MIGRSSHGASHLHPSRHLLYAFFIGALITGVGFTLARSHARSMRAQSAVLVAGSESLRPALTSCAEAFMKDHPNEQVIVRGGGSATGIAALLAGQIDVAMTSRALTASDIDQARIEGHALREIVLAKSALAIITHPDVQLSEVTVAQLSRLFAGDSDDWAEIGAPSHDVTVAVVGRAAGSGSAALIEARILEHRQLVSSARLFDTHDAVIDAIGSIPGAIGYTEAHLSEVAGARVNVLAIRTSTLEPAVLPQRESIADETYPLTRKLYAVTSSHSSGVAQRLVERCRTSQALLEEVGLTPANVDESR